MLVLKMFADEKSCQVDPWYGSQKLFEWLEEEQTHTP